MLLLSFIVEMLVKLWIEDPLSSGSSASITARKIAFTPRLCHMSKVSKAIFDHTFDHFWRESKAIFVFSQM